MENVNMVASVSPQMPAREISIVTAEIKELCRQANRMALMYAIEIGRRLYEAKSVLPHGAWGEWLRREVDFSQATANNFMKLFDEYGAEQISIFGAVVNSQSFANLPYTKALQLLALPSEEREDFAKEVDAEHISVRELTAAIKERDSARKEAEEAKAREDELSAAVARAEKARAEAEKQASEANAISNAATATIDLLKKQAADAKEREKKAKDKLKEAETNPKISPEVLEKLREEARAEAEKQAKEGYDAEIEKIRKKAEDALSAKAEAERKADEADAELAAVKAKLKTANPEISAFKALFDSLQETAGKLKNMIKKIGESDGATAEKLTAAMKAFGASL